MSENTNRIHYSKKVNEWLISTSGCGLGDFCRKFGYPKRETKIVEELDEDDQEKTMKIIKGDKELTALWRKSKDNKRVNARRGGRSLTEYYKTLVSGWVMEDLVVSMLKKHGIDVCHNGSDGERNIDKEDSVSQDPDLIVKVGDNARKVELTCEFNDILNREGYIEKRAPSLYRLWESKSLWLWFDLPSGKYILVDFATEAVSLMLRWHSFWNKDVHRYTFEEHGKKVRDDRLLAAELISVVGCWIEGKEQPALKETIDLSSPPHKWDLGGVHKVCKAYDVKAYQVPKVEKEKIEKEEQSVESEAQGNDISYSLTDEELGIDGFA